MGDIYKYKRMQPLDIKFAKKIKVVIKLYWEDIERK